MRFWGWGLILLLPLTASAQSTRTEAKPKLSQAARECKTYIQQIQRKPAADFNALDTEQLREINSRLSNCILDHNAELTKEEIVTAHINSVLASQGACVSEMAEAMSKYGSTRNVSSVAEHQLTISALPVGYTLPLVIGGSALRCSMVAPMELECKRAASYGYVYDSRMTAMMAVDMSGARYLIGCPQSRNCAPLVPGSYPFETAGDDAIMIKGLVTEGDKNSESHTGIYSILARNP
jgi:hypothetical protein